MTTDQKIAHIRARIKIAKERNLGLENNAYFLGMAQGHNNAWFNDGSIDMATWEQLNKELDE